MKFNRRSLLAIIFSGILFAQQFSGLDYVINNAISNQIFPGATVIVGNDSSILYHEAYGRFTYNASSALVDTNSIFDQASCTKVFATTSCIMKLVDSGLVDINEYVATYLPDFAQNGKANVRIKNLLLHNSGLAAYYSPSSNQTPEQIIQAIFGMGLVNPIGTYLYSCLNFVTLMKVVDAVTGEPMYQFFENHFTTPLGMERTMFAPPDSLHSSCLPTAPGLQGVVHDPLARGLLGYSGNAGLFATTGDLARICQLLLNEGNYGGIQYLSASIVNQFTVRYDPNGSTRALGWGTNASGSTSAGSLFSLESFGHTGYTGTSVWIDPVNNLFVVFLTNRVYPDDTAAVTSTRKLVHDAAVRAVAGIPPQPILKSIQRDVNDNLYFNWSSNIIMGPVDSTEIWIDTGNGFELYGYSEIGTTNLSLPINLYPADSLIQIKLRNIYIDQVSAWSDTYPCRGIVSQALIVDGYDRIGSWGQPYHHFATVHAEAFPDTINFATCDNDAIIAGTINLNDFAYVLWISADESTADETFNSTEQGLLIDYLKQGGKLFISGSEIGWDLGRSTSTSADRLFYNSYLKASYAGDDAGNYSVSGVSGSPFDGISFQYGTSSALYPEDYPDYISAVNGGSVCLKYGNARNAGVAFEGLFNNGSEAGKLVYLGFPFETIIGTVTRKNVMERVFDFFQQVTVAVSDNRSNFQPGEFSLSQNFPNPFNPITTIEYQIPITSNVDIRIFNILGEELVNLVSRKQLPGLYQINWDATAYASGMYFYILTTDTGVLIKKKMVVLK